MVWGCPWHHQRAATCTAILCHARGRRRGGESLTGPWWGFKKKDVRIRWSQTFQVCVTVNSLRFSFCKIWTGGIFDPPCQRWTGMSRFPLWTFLRPSCFFFWLTSLGPIPRSMSESLNFCTSKAVVFIHHACYVWVDFCIHSSIQFIQMNPQSREIGSWYSKKGTATIVPSGVMVLATHFVKEVLYWKWLLLTV